eukprot:TRINITY_DN19046_c0_g1_i2.p1 TRINITY_DN19046_c0_g1~~TRINITY_DN19046_c0_g1_i2.p1  ORF type:complete len:584 (-),score=85.28 TRINITY_DN19046_c0_g1_i2:63-1748(-)
MERSVEPQNQSASPKVDRFQSSSENGNVASLKTGFRGKLSIVVHSELFDLFLVCVVAANFIFVIYAAELHAKGVESPFIAHGGYSFSLFYVVEITVRIYIDRLSYFTRASNLIDFGIVCADVAAETLIFVGGTRNPSLGLLRLFRIMKLLRAFQRLEMFHELWLMLHGLASTVRAMAWACFLILLVLLVCSLVSAELLNPLQTRLYADGGFEDCTSCANAFQGIIRSLFTWFLLIFCGEMWVDLVKPLVEAEPYTALIFASAYLLINIGLMNLVLTVIVDRAAAARVDDEGFKLQQKKDEWEKASQKLCRWCANIDADKSGTVSLEELETGAESNSDFKGALAAMDLGSEDLKTVFSILDEDNSGTVTYKEFVSQLYKIKTQDSHTLLVIIKHYLQDVRRSVQQQLVMLKTEMSERVDDKTASANKFVRLTVPATEVSVQSSPHSSAVSRLSNGLSCVDSRCVVDQECLESTSSAVLSVPQDRIENNLSRALMAAGSDDTMVQATNLSESAKRTTLEALTEAVEPSEISESMKVSVCSELRRLSGLTEQVVACLRRDSVEV